jgi:hypothetical protein
MGAACACWVSRVKRSWRGPCERHGKRRNHVAGVAGRSSVKPGMNLPAAKKDTHDVSYECNGDLSTVENGWSCSEVGMLEVPEMTIPRILFSIKKAAPATFALILLACSGKASHKNVCPIDGQPPEWSGQRKGDWCEYSHYSIIEKKTHSWWADCRKAR